MRQYFEELEHQNLRSFAVKSSLSKGKKYEEWPSFTRTCFQRDRDRIIHSKSFRRLKDKTQVFTSKVSDDFRSRLTHTIEVAQISRHLARLLKLNEDLTECIALAHDLGHSPFGHSGEDVLNELLKDTGGFEHNLHSLRIVEEIEQKYPKFSGLNLSYEVIEGLKKHDTPWDNPRIKSSFVSIEAQIVNLADEIAYNNHDIDDGLSSGILSMPLLIKELELFKVANDMISRQYHSLESHERQHLINSYIISNQVTNVFETTLKRIDDLSIESLGDIQKLKTKIVSFDADMEKKNKELRSYLFNNFYKSNSVVELNRYGQEIIYNIFHYLIENPDMIPNLFLDYVKQSVYSLKEVVAFFIAGMTDSYASRFCKINNISF